MSLPKISINGVSGQELDTALGTVVRFDRAGVGYVVAGSVPPTAAEAAALARQRLSDVREGEAGAVLSDLAKAGERFDALLFADVLEHLDDPIRILGLAREVALPEATLVASVPNVGHLSLVRDLVLGRFDPLPADRPKARIRDQLVRACQHADRVQLDRADPAEHGGDPGR